MSRATDSRIAAALEKARANGHELEILRAAGVKNATEILAAAKRGRR